MRAVFPNFKPYPHVHSDFTGEEKEDVYYFPSADPYMGEDKAFLDAVRSGDSSHIKSSYSDAAKTYQLSWAVRRSSEH